LLNGKEVGLARHFRALKRGPTMGEDKGLRLGHALTLKKKELAGYLSGLETR
jgi:hypothetical protein